VVSNTAGATSWDKNLKLAAEVEENTGITVLSHSVKKPGCGDEIMEYFKKHPETGVTDPAHVAFVGDRLTTDMMLANMTGGWGFWVKDGVIPFEKKNIVSNCLVYPSTSSDKTLAKATDKTSSRDSSDLWHLSYLQEVYMPLNLGAFSKSSCYHVLGCCLR
jgi:HAD superfamily phosphatase (TIGR01668 family)